MIGQNVQRNGQIVSRRVYTARLSSRVDRYHTGKEKPYLAKCSLTHVTSCGQFFDGGRPNLHRGAATVKETKKTTLTRFAKTLVAVAEQTGKRTRQAVSSSSSDAATVQEPRTLSRTLSVRRDDAITPGGPIPYRGRVRDDAVREHATRCPYGNDRIRLPYDFSFFFVRATPRPAGNARSNVVRDARSIT